MGLSVESPLAGGLRSGRRARTATTALTGVLAVTLLAACGGGGMANAGEDGSSAEGTDTGTTTVKGNPPYGPDHIMSKALTDYSDVVAEASNGSLTFEQYFADSLVKQPEVATSLDAGIVDLAYLGMAYTPSDFPADAWASQLGYNDEDRPVVGLLANAAAMTEWAYTEPALVEELDAAGVYPLIPRLQNHDDYQLLCKEPITSLQDAQGKRVRVGGEAYAKAVEAIGMTPVTLSGAEIYEGFERGVVDCFAGGETDMTGLGLWEVGKNYTAVGLPGWNSVSYASGNDFFESLNAEQQAAFEENRAEFMEIYYDRYITEQYRFFAEGAENGMKFLEPEKDLAGAIDQHFEGVRKSTIADAPASIPSPEASVERYDELLDKWTNIVVELGYDEGHATKVEWAQAHPDGLDLDLGPWSEKLQTEIFDQHS